MHAEESCFNAIAIETQVISATAQLAVCRAALRLWQHRAEQPGDEFDPARIGYELAYYTQQTARWQQYLAGIAPTVPDKAAEA
jgi:hypothetical protein